MDDKKELEREGLYLAALEAEKDAEHVRGLLSALIVACTGSGSCIVCGKLNDPGWSPDGHKDDCSVRAAEQAFVYNVREMSPAQVAAREVLVSRRPAS